MSQNLFAPVVIGIPRSGFSLLISVLNNFFYQVPNKFNSRSHAYRIFCSEYGKQISIDIVRAFMRHGLEDDIIFNDNFRFMVGGPIWNWDVQGQRAYFRKYIGAGKLGDFTLLTSHPLGVLDQYEVIHSHGPFNDWISVPHFDNYERFASIRNPTGIINSACHSLNALSSEYIQRYAPNLNVEKTRKNLAYYKLTDLNFFDALLRPLKSSLKELEDFHEYFRIIAWEDIVTNPKETIFKLASDLKLPLSNTQCSAIWENIGFRNLTGAHKHNYRVGKAYVGDERESLTNEHIDIMKEQGFDDLAEFFGYGTLEYIPRSEYTEFQKKVETYLKRGDIYDPLEDRVLFDLAFNKSNIDFSSFGFRTYDWREHTRIERSNIEDPALELDVWDAAEKKVAAVSELFIAIERAFDGKGSVQSFIETAKSLRYEFPDVNQNGAVNAIAKYIAHYEVYGPTGAAPMENDT
ncbi:MAG: hypothetical protein CMM28_14900 [Rhodospirillaceae bacterium]|nr:hypothetical protein [Rhodospirillaceae bacterium]